MTVMSGAFFEQMVAAAVQDPPDALLDDPAIVWLDWKEEPEDIVHELGTRSAGVAVVAELLDEGETSELVLRRGDRREAVRLDADSVGGHFDRCVRAVARLLGPEESVRLVVASNGSDTLGFVVASAERWRALRERFGPELDRRFCPVDVLPDLMDTPGDQIEAAIAAYAGVAPPVADAERSSRRRRWWRRWFGGG